MMESGFLVEVCDVSLFKDGEKELDRLSFAIAPGERLIVVGEAGAGKDALLRAVGGFTGPGDSISGVIRYGGHAAHPRGEGPSIRQAFLPNPRHLPFAAHVSLARQLIKITAANLGAPAGSAREELRAALAHLPGNLTLELIDARPEQIDPVTQALALLAAATAQAPDLVLASAPFADLGPKANRMLLEALDGAQKRLGFALLYASGGLQAAARLGGRVLVLKDGRIIEEGDAARLMSGQTHAYTRRLIQSLPVLREDLPVPKPAQRGQPLLQIHNLSFGPNAQRDALTFELRRGASLALIGDPGSGRRQILRLMLGFDPAPPGQVLFDSVDLNVLSEAMAARIRRRIAFISGKDDTLDPRMTLWDTVEEPLRAHLNLSGELVASYREAALKRVGLASHDGARPVSSLCAFDKRRLQVARAIVGAPLLVVVDEPQTGLDAFARTILREVLSDFRAAQGPAFLVLTADFTIAQMLAEDAMVFEAGKLVEKGPIAQLLREPKSQITKDLIAAVRLPPLPPSPEAENPQPASPGPD
jgi:ATPase components of various ABC-type transport systems, contain duplicated ATPase